MYKLQAAVRECDRRLCQWCGVNVRRLPIQPLIHSRGRSLPKVFLGYVWLWVPYYGSLPLLSAHMRLDRQTLVITKYSSLLPIWPPNYTFDHLARSGCWRRPAGWYAVMIQMAHSLKATNFWWISLAKEDIFNKERRRHRVLSVSALERGADCLLFWAAAKEKPIHLRLDSPCSC